MIRTVAVNKETFRTQSPNKYFKYQISNRDENFFLLKTLFKHRLNQGSETIKAFLWCLCNTLTHTSTTWQIIPHNCIFPSVDALQVAQLWLIWSMQNVIFNTQDKTFQSNQSSHESTIPNELSIFCYHGSLEAEKNEPSGVDFLPTSVISISTSLCQVKSDLTLLWGCALMLVCTLLCKCLVFEMWVLFSHHVVCHLGRLTFSWFLCRVDEMGFDNSGSNKEHVWLKQRQQYNADST